jgi:hypothetical protein
MSRKSHRECDVIENRLASFAPNHGCAYIHAMQQVVNRGGELVTRQELLANAETPLQLPIHDSRRWMYVFDVVAGEARRIGVGIRNMTSAG